jgi:hypothetical protein
MWTFPAPKMSTSLLTTLAPNSHLAQGQFLLQEQTSNNAKVSDIPSRNSETINFQNGRVEFNTTVDLSKEECIEAVPPHT